MILKKSIEIPFELEYQYLIADGMYHCFPKIKKHISTSKRHLHVCTVKKPG